VLFGVLKTLNQDDLSMIYPLNETHDPKLQSWVESANDRDSDFPIQNCPFCVFRRPNQAPAIGVGIGDQILDLHCCESLGFFKHMDVATQAAIMQQTLNGVMALSLHQRESLRKSVIELLNAQSTVDRDAIRSCLCPQSSATLLLPCRIGDYTDFYASVYHATNIGIMLRPNNPLLPNYKYIPIGYHGRASSVIVSGTTVRRPWGQTAPAQEGESPKWDISRTLDYELELGCLVSQGNSLGEPISINDAETRMFGICLLNDWSARDIQKWEYQPLGPFLAKSFATTISPWVVTMEALAPFRCAEFARPSGDPQPLPYLASEANAKSGGIDLNLEVYLQSAQMREQGIEPVRLSTGKFTGMYWTLAQMITHHSSNGCNLQPGDLIGSGTISGPEKNSRGCMQELTWDGDIEHPLAGSERTGLTLPTGELRKFLADGDQVILKGFCSRANFRRIGLGSCSGVIAPAKSL
jgi:fumarylacetoacetase